MPHSTLTTNIYAALLMVGVIQSIFFIVMLLTIKNGNRQANVFLALLMLVFALDLIDEYFLFTELSLSYSKIHLLNYAIDFIFGPLFYLYAVTMTQQQTTRERSLFHMGPFFLATAVVLMLSVQFSNSAVSQVIHFNGNKGWLAGALNLMDLLAALSMLGYLVFSYLYLRRHQNLIGDYYSYQKKVNLKWLSMILTGLILLFIVYILVPVFSDEATVYQSNFVFYLLLILMINMAGYSGLKQPKLFLTMVDNSANDELKEAEETVVSNDKYHKSALSTQQAEAFMRELDKAMVKFNLYLDEGLTLDNLATKSGIPKHWVSQTINGVRDINFYDYVNAFRVEEAKRLLEDERFAGKKIIEIAYQSGFKAKSSFNLVFKKACDMTPSQYRMQFKKSKQIGVD